MNEIPPTAIIDNKKFNCLQNPEILTWTDVGNNKLEGRGMVLVTENNPLLILDLDLLIPKKTWGKFQLSLACISGRYGPLIIEEDFPNL